MTWHSLSLHAHPQPASPLGKVVSHLLPDAQPLVQSLAKWGSRWELGRTGGPSSSGVREVARVRDLESPT